MTYDKLEFRRYGHKKHFVDDHESGSLRDDDKHAAEMPDGTFVSRPLFVQSCQIKITNKLIVP